MTSDEANELERLYLTGELTSEQFETELRRLEKRQKRQEASQDKEPPWFPINTAPKDGTIVEVRTNSRNDVMGEPLPSFDCFASYHPDAGWCVDELREVTHWRPI